MCGSFDRQLQRRAAVPKTVAGWAASSHVCFQIAAESVASSGERGIRRPGNGDTCEAEKMINSYGLPKPSDEEPGGSPNSLGTAAPSTLFISDGNHRVCNRWAGT